jgi:oxygen-independent coproporphyrinogen-3 oxidase
MSVYLSKYDVAVPRYTSYPPLPSWKGPPSEEDWGRSLATFFDPTKGIDSYIHIPFCSNECRYCGCNRITCSHHEFDAPYVAAVLKEWSLLSKYLPSAKMTSLHLGGGTPNFLPASLLEKLIDGLPLSETFSGSIELNPATTDISHIALLARKKFKNISLGIQDFDPSIQESIQRKYAFEEAFELVKMIREAGPFSLNFDLIYGLPGQTPASIAQTCEKVIMLGPDRIAWYAYAHVPWKAENQKGFAPATIPSGETRLSLREPIRIFLEKAGYVAIGLDHFARKGSCLHQSFESKKLKRNFMGYCTRGSNILAGLGVSSISRSPYGYVQNAKTLESYMTAIHEGRLPITNGHVMSANDRIIEPLIQKIMCYGEADLAALEEIAERDSIKFRMEGLINDGLIHVKDRRLTVASKGLPYLRNVASSLDLYKQEQAASNSL